MTDSDFRAAMRELDDLHERLYALIQNNAESWADELRRLGYTVEAPDPVCPVCWASEHRHDSDRFDPPLPSVLCARHSQLQRMLADVYGRRP